MPDIMKIVAHLLQTKMGVDKRRITLEADLVRDLGLDSLDVVELIMEVEKEFDITIADEELQEIVTVKDMVASINKKR